ncbi:hypothetical protein HAX54_008089 [Datura stramonium]|uniref:Uncharacterized protein n=1 Tax=Datura stramonium TaxID=4076 RepID=A0ABS8TE99_DATST|nr:hypothetical protein [Datura stramonium]
MLESLSQKHDGLATSERAARKRPPWRWSCAGEEVAIADRSGVRKRAVKGDKGNLVAGTRKERVRLVYGLFWKSEGICQSGRKQKSGSRVSWAKKVRFAGDKPEPRSEIRVERAWKGSGKPIRVLPWRWEHGGRPS